MTRMAEAVAAAKRLPSNPCCPCWPPPPPRLAPRYSRSARPAIRTTAGGANKVGPNLWGVVNRPIASHAGFAYSAPMKEFAQGGSVVWDYDHLDKFLASPKGLVKGTAMGFAGLKKVEERAALIAYLRAHADSPAPLPDPAAAPAAEPAAAPADGAAPADARARAGRRRRACRGCACRSG